MLVGLTGRNASGKTTVVQWFASRGVQTLSCSDSIRRWLSEEGIKETRESLIEGGRELRRRGGAGVLAEMLLEELSGDAFSGPRHCPIMLQFLPHSFQRRDVNALAHGIVIRQCFNQVICPHKVDQVIFGEPLF